jgi:hypothetical protein
MISSHELQQSCSNGGNCGHKKKPVRMPVEPRIKRHGGKTTQLDKGPKAVPARLVVDSTRRAAGYAAVTAPLPSLDKQLRG